MVGAGLLVLACAGHSAAQPGSSGAAVTNAQPPAPRDPLGRETPRGTLVGFMRAAREGNLEVAAQYLNVRAAEATELARKLYVVLDSRLPARLNDVSDLPEGALANPLKPDQDIAGTISTANGPLDVVFERVTRGSSAPMWLFSRRTLESIPQVYDEVDLVSVDRFLPGILTRYRLGNVRLFDWLVLIVIVPACYRLFGLLNPLMALVMARPGRRGTPIVQSGTVPGFLRLLLLAVGIRWLLAGVDLPFAERRFWSVTTALFVIVAAVWMTVLLTKFIEAVLQRRFREAGSGEFTDLLRLTRGMANVLIVAAGGLITLNYFGVDPTAALAGLGIGGIAVALAAQKTLENVIGGLSIIFDKAVRVGDSLKLGETSGTVDYIGLRSTRIRTIDRTILSVPNGQVANVNIETLSARDKFRFHHVVPLRQETTAEKMRLTLDAIRTYLGSHPAVDLGESVRAQFVRLGPFSFDVEVFVYVRAADWDRFLDIQQELLLGILTVVERAGASIALPSQTLHLSDASTHAAGALTGTGPWPA